MLLSKLVHQLKTQEVVCWLWIGPQDLGLQPDLPKDLLTFMKIVSPNLVFFIIIFKDVYYFIYLKKKKIFHVDKSGHPKIIHRDIKAANILIDNNFEAMVIC